MDNGNSLDAPTVVGAVSQVQMSAMEELGLPEVDGHEIIRELGRGGMGVVYLAKQISLGRMVALKTIPARSDEEFERLLLSEAQIVAKLEHPGIVPIYEARADRNVWWFSMGLVVGEDLAHRLARGVFSADQVVRLTIQIADALQHAHEHGVLHHDIKPANILLDASGKPKLADFGLAAVLANSREPLAQVGTPLFMSPEQAVGDTVHFCAASDIYSLGAVMYAAVTGRPPIVSANTQDLIAKVLSMRPTSMRQAGVRVPVAFEAIVSKCLEKDVRKRYQSASELKEDLLAFQEGKPVKARPPGIFSTAIYQLRQHIFAASVSGSLAVLLLVLLGVLTYRIFSSQSKMNSLLDENQRLKQLAIVQREQFRSSISSNVAESDQASIEYQLLSNMAVKLNELGDGVHAAQYAAEAFQLANASGTVVTSDVRQIMLEFGKLHYGATDDTHNSASPAEVPVADNDAEERKLLERLAKLILANSENERNEIEISQSDAGAPQPELTTPNTSTKQQGEQ